MKNKQQNTKVSEKNFTTKETFQMMFENEKRQQFNDKAQLSYINNRKS